MCVFFGWGMGGERGEGEGVCVCGWVGGCVSVIHFYFCSFGLFAASFITFAVVCSDVFVRSTC